MVVRPGAWKRPSTLEILTMSTVTTDLLLLAEYREHRSRVFPSDESLRWFIRSNHAELTRRKALVMPAGRKLINPPEFDQAVLDIGARKAAGRSRGQIGEGV